MSLGCKVNQSEISDMEQALKAGGHELVGLDDEPEICVVNTCTVTKNSDIQSRQTIRRAAGAGAKVIVTGCYASMNQAKVLEMGQVAQVVPNEQKDNIIAYIDSNIGPIKRLSGSGMRSRYFLKVQDGCDRECSYCLVWKARGRPRSMALEHVIERARLAEEAGYNEVILSGVHLGLYGKDLGGSLEGLVRGLLDRTEIPRIRLSSLEANELTPGIIKLLSDPRICQHVHVPLQSGHDRVLKAMNRQYDTGLFREQIAKLAEIDRDFGLGTDIIAGFPTETDEEFEASLDFAASLPFTYMHVFPYSPRPGTSAADLPDGVGKHVRKARAKTLRELAAWKKKQYLETQVGRTLDVLIESVDADGMASGTSGNYLKVALSGAAGLKGSLVSVRISGVSGGGVIGDIA